MFTSLMNGFWMYVFLIVGFGLLLKGADLFVDGASSIARLLKVPALIIGLTIVSMGTSLPELAVSIDSATKGQNGLCLGNVVGSNIFNTLMVLGCSALFVPVVVQKSLIKKDLPYNILIGFVLFIVSFDVIFSKGSVNTITRGDGIILLLFFAIYMFTVVYAALASRKEFEEQTKDDIKQMGVAKSIIFTVLGAVAIVVGGDMTVDAATAIARRFGMSETMVGLTIIAIGTSLPELVTSCVAAKKGETDLAVGNVVGSNIFNALLILGVSSVINPIELTDPHLLVDVLIMLAISVVTFFVCLDKKIRRWEGIIMILLYASYMVYVCMR